MFFSENGNVKAWPTCLLAAVAAAFASMESPFGFISYQPDQILRLMVPVSGVFVALALPAAQLAQSVKERLFGEAIDLLSSQQGDVEGVRKTLRTVTVQYRQALETMRLMIYLSLASFLTGLAGLFEVASRIPAVGPLDSASFIACLSVSLLVAAVLWLVPIIQSSSDLSMADETIGLLQDPPVPEPPPAPGG
ncbi:hypothetical protein [Pseudoxanthomonas wuyuanensis]|nr:hypothetical protein [Pseudoxanthomonas wuyuanensis]